MSNLLRPLAACLVVIVMSAAPAPAQSPDAVAAAKDLMAVMHSADNFKAMMPSIMQALKPAVVQGRPEVARDFDELMPKLIGAMTARLDEMIGKIAGVYARRFSAAELRGSPTSIAGRPGRSSCSSCPASCRKA